MKSYLKNQSGLSMLNGNILSTMNGKKWFFLNKVFKNYFQIVQIILVFRLPIILGENYMKSFGLFPLTQGYSSNYRNDFDPRITNAFATAGFRMGHSLIPEMIKYIHIQLLI